MSLLEVRDLRVTFDTAAGPVRAVDGLSFALEAGDALAMVGESGSGKSQAALAILGLLGAGSRAEGSVRFDGAELLNAPARALEAVRGAGIGLVFQNASGSLNPHLTVGTQVAEPLRQHHGLGRVAALAEARRLLDLVQVPDATRRLWQYPHECSGGMRQRIAIAAALAGRPRLLIADEPTTGLDATVQSRVLQLLAGLRRELDLALLLISHDLGAVAALCERVLVLYAGSMMEQGDAGGLLARPGHPYTAALLAARPVLRGPRPDRLEGLAGRPPDGRGMSTGCPFEPRCRLAFAPCATERPLPSAQPAGERCCHASAEAVAGLLRVPATGC